MIEFEYKGFWIESTPFNQAENGHPEEGFTYTSYVLQTAGLLIRLSKRLVAV